MDDNIKIIKFLLDRDAPIYTKDDADISPLIFALENLTLRPKVCELVIQKAKTIKPKNNFTQIVANINELEIPIDKNQLILDIFVTTNSVNDKNQIGDTPLIALCMNGLFNLAEILLEKGADINAQNNSGFTALLAAIDYACRDTEKSQEIEQAYLQFIKILLTKGANIMHQDTKGNSAISIALNNNFSEFIKLLR